MEMVQRGPEPRTRVPLVRVRADFKLPFVPSVRFIPRSQIPQLITVYISGDRKIKIPVMDPLFIPEFRLISHGLDVSVQNSTAVGMKDVILKKVG